MCRSSRNGPFPLVIYSHGWGGARFYGSFDSEVLASHGFVVAAPDHKGATVFDVAHGTVDGNPRIDLNLPADSSFVITTLERRSATPGDPFAGDIDASKVAMTGHAYGAYNTFATVSGHTNAVGTVRGDPRVKAIVAMVPYSGPLSSVEVRHVNVPTLILTGTHDTTSPSWRRSPIIRARHRPPNDLRYLHGRGSRVVQ